MNDGQHTTEELEAALFHAVYECGPEPEPWMPRLPFFGRFEGQMITVADYSLRPEVDETATDTLGARIIEWTPYIVTLTTLESVHRIRVRDFAQYVNDGGRSDTSTTVIFDGEVLA